MSKYFLYFLVFSLVISGCASPLDQATSTIQVGAQVTQDVPTASQTQTVSANLEPLATKTAQATEVAPASTVATATAVAQPAVAVATIEEVIEYEMRGAFDFFWEQANTDPNSAGYGLIRDRYPGSEGISSVASVGFGLTAYLVGVEKGYITTEEAAERVSKTLDTLLAMDRTEGFYYHFVDMQTGKRAWTSEVSNIDTSILLMGVLSVGEYFGGEIADKARQIYAGVNWPWFIDTERKMFYMAYSPEEGFAGHWDFYAEQLMLYVLAAGSETYPVDEIPYYTFTRHKAKYGDGQPFIHSWFGSIFTYQFSHAWIDFSGYKDKKDVNWFDNSVEASLAQYNFAINMDQKYETLGPNAWGLTACDGPGGYNGLYGAPPSGFDDKQHKVDDTIAPSGAIGSIVFLPQPAQQAMLNYYSIDALKGPYGFFDAYNLTKDWVDTDVIGIDKGISLLMLANFQNDFVYKIMMENAYILNGLERLHITPKE